ncbi:DNA mismatch repair protein MSH5 [Smittium culicis]|uniref:DNA mismatch repair protein MSH5 n=1 Tax=Smittium culicis TaxID=133412 RepID=A0A1R1XTI5_9FUNG|nr:DNA mismatch repair protein MSH5 [Smittium culicis]
MKAVVNECVDVDEKKDFGLTNILCIQVHGGFVGAAHYSFGNRALKVLEDTKENCSFDLCTSLVRQIIPDIIITNNKNEDLVEVLKKQIPIIMVTPSVSITSTSDFQFSTGNNRLVSSCSHIAISEAQKQVNASDGTFLNPDDSVFQWVSSILGNNSNLSIGCAGALLLHLQKTHTSNKSSNPDTKLVRTLAKLTVDPIMHISFETMQALDIFSSEKHPNMHIRSKQKKEGLSLFRKMISFNFLSFFK